MFEIRRFKQPMPAVQMCAYQAFTNLNNREIFLEAVFL